MAFWGRGCACVIGRGLTRLVAVVARCGVEMVSVMLHRYIVMSWNSWLCGGFVEASAWGSS